MFRCTRSSIFALGFMALVTIALHSSALGQSNADDGTRPSMFYFVAGEAPSGGLAIAHGGLVPMRNLIDRQVDGVLLELAADHRGPVDFYVDGTFLETQSHPPFLLLAPDLLSGGTRTILAIPDVGYAVEVTYTLE